MLSLPLFICHDVLQKTRFTHVQRAALNGRSMNEAFVDTMKVFEGHPMILAVLGEGLIENNECIEYIKSHPEWVPQCHGYRHIRYDVVPDGQFIDDMRHTQDLIAKHFNKRPTIFIPPYNKYTPRTAEMCLKLGMEQQGSHRKPGHYKNNMDDCGQVDFHFWSEKNMRMTRYILNYFTVQPHYIIGAPRSGTTALMRFMADGNTIALKEKEAIWTNNINLRKYYARLMTDNNATNVIDKNVRNSMRILDLQEQFPNAAFTHIIRDGRAAISSWRDWAVKTKKDDQSVEGAAIQWTKYVTYILNNKHLLNDYREVRYEEMCFKHPYFVSRNNKWKTRLSSEELNIVLGIAGPLLRNLGYV